MSSIPRIPRGRVGVDDAVVLAAAARLTERDRYLIRLVGEHRVLTTGQVCALGFGSVITARHRLGVLAGMGALRRFRPRREVGSAPWHYLLGPLGAALLAAEDRDERKWLPRVREDRQLALARSQRLAHLTGVNWFFAALARHARQGGGELAEWLGEAGTADRYNYHARSRYADVALPHPDGSGTWVEGGREVTFLLEFDTGSENLAQVASKLEGYGRMAEGLAGAELACPPLLFCFPGPRRELAARGALARCRDAPALRIATAAFSPEQVSPAGPVWMPLSGAGGPPQRLIGLAEVMPDPWQSYRDDLRERRDRMLRPAGRDDPDGP
ncbi:MAG TPA: replication-relaxation family protein [Streptosporangiaceae bacterium]|nr:replication-relaxation family protein [Streptosporangiaceae bacterium]